MPGSTSLHRVVLSSAKNKKAQDRSSKEEEKLVVQLWAEKRGFAGNRAALTAWREVLFTDFVLKCDCSFPGNFFVTGRFQVPLSEQISNCPLIESGK